MFGLMNNVSILHFQLYKDQSTILDLKNNTPRMYIIVKNTISQVNVRKKLINKYLNPTIYNLFIKMAPECEKVNMYFN